MAELWKYHIEQLDFIGKNSMGLWSRAMFFSSVIHLAVIGGAVTATLHIKKTEKPVFAEPVFIDFTMNASFQSEKGSSRLPGKNNMPEKPEPEKTDAGKIRKKQVVAAAIILSEKKQAACGKRHSQNKNAQKADFYNCRSQAAGSSSRLQETGGAKETIHGRSFGNAAEEGNDTDKKEERYMLEHFSYIRERIRKQLRYPVAAARMGLSGKVLVSFTVLENGDSSDLAVSKSSGARILDIDAVDTVRMAAPFPPPPARAKIVIPVDYILE